MYDAQGADSGREWIEIQNTGNENIDMGNWKFFEEGVNHKLVPEGSSIVAPGAFAIVADDSALFRVDYPNFSGTLFTSSFSLKNTGESVALKDKTLTILASAVYAGDEAKGDGNSLNLVSGSFVARQPTPGGAVAGHSIAPPAAVPARNLPKKDEVREKDAIEGNGESGEPALAASVIGEEGAPAPGILLWLIALLAVAGAGAAAVYMVRRTGGSGYAIIEDKT